MPTAQILSHQAQHTLKLLHAELCGKVDANKKEAERLAESIQHVEAVLKMLDPSFSLVPLAIHRRKVNPWFKRGTQFRYVLEALREAGTPLTTAEIVTAMIKAKGIENPSQAQIEIIFGSVGKSLAHQIGITVVKHEGRPVRWAIMV